MLNEAQDGDNMNFVLLRQTPERHKNVGLYDCAAMRVTALQLSIRRMANWLIEQAFGLGGETVASAY
jgi:hypothetical protein